MATTIPFNKPLFLGTELAAVASAVQSSSSLAGRGDFTTYCEQRLSAQLNGARVFLTTSGTAALEISAMLCDLAPGDEVIAPSYTFVSTVNAFVLRGATIVFVDVEAGTMTLDPSKIEAAISPRTRAIVPVQYAGIACSDMDAIMALAAEHGLLVIEDAAQALACSYHTRPVGSFGHMACFSFHATKNMTAGGQGGAIAINDPTLLARAEIVYDYGTNRSAFFRHEVPRYEWIDIGSNFCLPEPQAAFLWAQLQAIDLVSARRRQLWNVYHSALLPLHEAGVLTLPPVREGTVHAGHLFFFFVHTALQRRELVRWMKEASVEVSAHYVPLHSAPLGKTRGRFVGEDVVTTKGSETLVRLPMFYELEDDEQNIVIEKLKEFYADAERLEQQSR
ncbi:hypothetical protein MMC17_001928 [Xylographa soralifera]|nr:hypothetical protein [Xylographa soralifera]